MVDRLPQVVLDHPAELPEGCRVTVEPIAAEEAVGTDEATWRNTPEAIADWLQWYDSLEPIARTPEEEAEWEAARKAQRAREKAASLERGEQLRRMWE